MRRPIVFLLACLAFAIAGCSGSPPPKEKKEEQKKAAAPREIEIKEATVSALNDAIKNHKGKVVVVDVWATFCLPCMQEFPHLVELHKRYDAKDVVCVSVSVDDEKQKDAALKFLKKQGATFENYQVEYGDLQNDWVFSGVPIVRVYSRAGAVVEQFNNADVDKKPFTYAEVEQAVKKQLAK